MRNKRFIAAALAAGMLIGVPSAGAAAKLIITGDNIKNGTVTTRDLSEGVQRKLDTRATTVNASPSRNGVDGKDGAQGVKGNDGAKGATGAQGERGPVGPAGADGVAWERVQGNCVNSSNAAGEVMVIDGALKIGSLNTHGAYGQFKMLVENVRLSDIDKLSFTAKGNATYLKLKLEGNRFIVFQPGANGGNATDTITYNVAAADGKLRDNNDSGTTPTFSLAELEGRLGNPAVKSLEITGGCAGSAIDGAVMVDDVTLNDTVIDFN